MSSFQFDTLAHMGKHIQNKKTHGHSHYRVSNWYRLFQSSDTLAKHVGKNKDPPQSFDVNTLK